MRTLRRNLLDERLLHIDMQGGETSLIPHLKPCPGGNDPEAAGKKFLFLRNAINRSAENDRAIENKAHQRISAGGKRPPVRVFYRNGPIATAC